MVVAPYNPFIKVFNSATEVHLTDHKPTTGANNRFPSGADISRGDVDGTYFICKDGFPFAIHVDARLDASILNLDLKKENQRIDKTYPKFAEWAKNARSANKMVEIVGVHWNNRLSLRVKN